MPIQPTYPGVYVQELPSGVRTITGVSTSIALFIGRTTQGPLNEPIQCLSYTDFVRVFSDDNSLSDMAYHVQLFFINGGTNCYVMRIAEGASQSTVTLRNEANTDDVLILTARQHGILGENIRTRVTYPGNQIEHTFTLEVFRWEMNAAGVRVAVGNEIHEHLNMDPNSSRYAPALITQNSQLISATPVPGMIPTSGYSQAGRPITAPDFATFQTEIAQIIGDDPAAAGNDLTIQVDGNQPVAISLASLDISSFASYADLEAAVQGIIETAYTAIGITVAVEVSFDTNLITDTAVLRITSDRADGSIVITAGGPNDASASLMLGAQQGGIEVSPYASHRPAPTGLTFNPIGSWADFAAAQQDAVSLMLNELDATAALTDVEMTVGNLLVTASNTDPMFQAAADFSPANGDMDGVREKLALLRDAVNDYQLANPRTFFWRASLAGYRLRIYSTRSEDNVMNPNAAIGFTRNVSHYALGISGAGSFQIPAALAATDGTFPQLSTYDRAYPVIENQVDLFNLLVLPPDREATYNHADLYGPASVFCQQQRAFLLMDAPSSWATSQQAAAGVDAVRLGLVNDHSALYYPRLRVNDDGREVMVGPSGAMAGLIARIDSSRGVWKAPAGTEASLRGIRGLEHRFSDRENGVMNPRGINTLRIFPNGIVSWGARTLAGDDDFASEWKYVPVRRTALFIEKSLYRGLKWVVFEPNDEPLWAQIRLNVGAFMHNLFRQGAFQGATKNEAYFVKCDRETTTQNDINLGIVNIWVGFAPLKPAEFVILSLQQMTGQIEV